ncbi:hypothetical protein [Serratia liquefaciens]|uniref:hypothetical protein n=1 Tax=Serratia liquefaciens TaxID=614 RepID=UPI002182660E|nr:hypothetical protein [Serratia liquefaciens]CAI2407274.1 Uncharacterised protein [Serratia liquefaciens]
MTNLGSLLSAGQAEQLTSTLLRAGAVIYMHCNFTTPPKNKYLVVVCCEPELLVLVINSEVNGFVQSRPELLDCQVDVPKADHDFLDHDSVVDCVETQTAFNLTEVRDALFTNSRSVYRGRLANYVIREVIDAVDRSETMEARHCRWIRDALTASLQ